MTRRLVRTTVVAFLLACATTSAQQLVMLPPGTWATDVTPDGEIVVGSAPGGGFIWRWRVDPAPTYITGGSDIVAVSDDGSVLAGNWTDPITLEQSAAFWTASGGWQTIPGLGVCGSSASTAYDITGDGSTIVGLAWLGCNAYGFKTAPTGLMQSLELLANGINRATSISGDGSAIGGFAQGSFTRTPAYWQLDLTGFVIDPAIDGEVYGFSEDGSISVGTRRVVPAQNYSAYRRAEDGTTLVLGSLYNGWDGQAYDVSEDGNVIVGFDVNQLARDAWIWTPVTGIISLEEHLADLGVPNVPDLLVCRKVSDDGTVVVGGGGDFFPGFSGFIAEIDTDAWSGLGGGTNGQFGVPDLAGWGSLVPGTPFYIEMTGARPNALTLLWLAAPSNPIQVFGGTLHAFPPVPGTELLLATSASGKFLGGALWPAGLPAGTEITFQFLIDDPFAVPWGINMSNGLRATTP